MARCAATKRTPCLRGSRHRLSSYLAFEWTRAPQAALRSTFSTAFVQRSATREDSVIGEEWKIGGERNMDKSEK
jgi:hypothetical protein